MFQQFKIYHHLNFNNIIIKFIMKHPDQKKKKHPQIEQLNLEQTKMYLMFESQMNEDDKKFLFNIVKNKQISTAKIREILAFEGQKCDQGYYITQGQVILKRNLLTPANLQKLQQQRQKHSETYNYKQNLTYHQNMNNKTENSLNIANIGEGQIINLQARIHNWQVKYTAIVATSTLKYFILSDQELLFLYPLRKDLLFNQEQLRENQYNKQKIKFNKKMERKHKQQVVSALMLPEVKIQKSKSVASLNKSNKRDKPIDISNNKLRTTFSLQKLKLNINELTAKQQTELNTIHSKDLINSKYLPMNTDRNEKLFKQHLRTIIKRKIVYQKRHLTVLQAFRNKQTLKSNQQSQKKETNPRIELVMEENQINHYFN